MLCLSVSSQTQPCCCFKTAHVALTSSFGLFSLSTLAQTSFATIPSVSKATQPLFERFPTCAANVLKPCKPFLAGHLQYFRLGNVVQFFTLKLQFLSFWGTVPNFATCSLTCSRHRLGIGCRSNFTKDCSCQVRKWFRQKSCSKLVQAFISNLIRWNHWWSNFIVYTSI